MKKKLIEVALPLDAINAASAREKSIRHGHPSTLHLWWARRPLAAARAVIFAQMVDDPSSWPDLFPTEKAQEKEGRRLFGIIEELVKWENTTNERVLQAARDEIWQSWRRACAENADHPRAAELFDRHKLPAFHDPFAGGGASPPGSPAAGLEAHASDLNPVAVLINKAMIEIPPTFAGRPPVNPDWQAKSEEQKTLMTWTGAQDLAEDVRYYGQWMRDEAEKRIGHLYPKIEITEEMAEERPDLEQYVGRKLTVIAWLWARTVKSPNPAFADVDVPLASTFMLSTKKGKEAYVEPVVENGGYRFTVKVGAPLDPAAAKAGTTAGKRQAFRCLMSGVPLTYDHIRSEGKADQMGTRLMAIVAEGDRGRVYLEPLSDHEAVASEAAPSWKPDMALPNNPRDFKTPNYGLTTFGDLFTPRQLVALTTFSDLVAEARTKIIEDYPAPEPGSAGVPPASGPKARPNADPTWHNRGYLPHFEAGEVPQSITFRLHDSLPATLRAKWEAELKHLPQARQQRERRTRIEAALDRGHGACYLREPGIARLVQDALRHFDGERYRLHAWCVMPNHVHVLATPLGGHTLSSILHAWKSFTSHRINTLLDRRGLVWLEEYFDRAIRNERHFATVVEYIEHNPVKAGLCAQATDWRWSSASLIGERASRPRAGQRPALPGDAMPLRDGGTGATAYAEAVGVYLAFAQSKACDRNTSLCRWECRDKLVGTFSRQALPMVWDFAETNPLAGAGGDILGTAKSVCEVVEKQFKEGTTGSCFQMSAVDQALSFSKLISTDPPYYDNIGYADLSDFFYVWLRRSLGAIFPDLFAMLAVPKAEELVATPYRHGSKDKAEAFFMTGMTQAMERLAEQAHPGFPVTIYYAFKQVEKASFLGSRASRPQAGQRPALPSVSTGWETFL